MSRGSEARSLVFDAGSVISLATNNLLWLLPPLKERFGGSFIITRSVENEIVTKPMQTKKFKFEAIQIRHLLATVIHAKASALVIDERPTRQLIEDPRQIARRMRIKLHKPVHTSKQQENMLNYELKIGRAH